MQQKRHFMINNSKLNNYILLGHQKCIKLPRVHEMELLNLLSINNQKTPSSVASYERILYCKTLFSIMRYRQTFLRADFVLSIRKNICFVLNYIIKYN